MMQHIEVRQPSSVKRKRIPLDPNLRQGSRNNKEEVLMPGDGIQPYHDDIDPYTKDQNRTTTKRGGEQQNGLTQVVPSYFSWPGYIRS